MRFERGQTPPPTPLAPRRPYGQASPLAPTRGFTFIELIATLAVIVLVAGMLLPVFARGRENARSTNCRSNLQQIIQAVHLYAQDFDGRFPPTNNELTFVSTEYCKNVGVFACPAEPPSSQRRHGVGVATGSPNPTRVYSSYQYLSGFANDDARGTVLLRDWHPWHQGGVNVGCLDGQVRWVRPNEVPSLTPGPRPAP